MNDAAAPMSAIESRSPKTRTTGCSRAAPATARTLSSDIETSAMMICQAACANVLRGAPPAISPEPPSPLRQRLFVGVRLDPWCATRATSSSTPTGAGSRPRRAGRHREQPRSDAREDDAQHRRGENADEDRPVALLARQPRRSEADHDGVVAGEHEVNEDDLEKGAYGLRGDSSVIRRPLHVLNVAAAVVLPVRRSRPRTAGPHCGHPVRHHSRSQLSEGPGLAPPL